MESTRLFVLFDTKDYVYDDESSSFHDLVPPDTRYINPKVYCGQKDLPEDKEQEPTKPTKKGTKKVTVNPGAAGEAVMHIGEAAVAFGGVGEPVAVAGAASINFTGLVAGGHAA